MERLAGAVERFVCESGGRVAVSKCRAVLGTAFAGGGVEVRWWNVAGLRQLACVPGWLHKRSEAEQRATIVK